MDCPAWRRSLRTFPVFEAWAWQGFSAPAKVSPGIIAKLRDAYLKAINDPETKQKLIAAGIDPLQSTPQEMAAYVAAETAKWEKSDQDRRHQNGLMRAHPLVVPAQAGTHTP